MKTEDYEPMTSVEIKVADLTGEVRTYTTIRNQWDCNIYDMVDMFKSVLLSMGFQPENIAEVLGEDIPQYE